MYSWGDSLEDWARPGAYRFDSARSGERARASERERAAGGRTYHDRRGPEVALTDPKKKLEIGTKNPLIVAVDVTGSMAGWPLEIFDRLPLLYNTLSQYRPDLEICFAAIGDAACDRWPLQTTTFAHGFDLETQLKALYGEGGGGDAPESYELFAHWVNSHIHLPKLEDKPFLIVFGDAPMHPTVNPKQVKEVMGDRLPAHIDAMTAWQKVTTNWNTWFLRRQGTVGDSIDKQWARAVGQQLVHIREENRAVDYAMGLIARHWGRLEDFRANLAARQDGHTITQVLSDLDRWARGSQKRSKRAS